ncbi:MAG: SusC/RagA family TonB-linked outer membrane protein [Candidatus Cryptobacteroides sp.]
MIKTFRAALASAMLVLFSAGGFVASAQSTKVTGKVVDENGAALVGIVVFSNNAKVTPVTTDADGTYTIDAPASASLTFSCLGYKEETVSINGRGVVNAVLRLDSFNLEDAVVIGYGSQKMKDLTGGVSVVNEETLKMVSTGNLMDRVSGQVAGLTITTGNEAPGSNQSLLIRGQNSLSATNSPLIILDGIPYEGSLADIDPDIVESMTVLKDASSVAIYGSRGSNGVILIQTKKGKQGSLQVTYKAQFSMAQPMQRIQVMGPNEYIRYKQDMGRLGTKMYTGEQLDPMAGQIISASEKVNYAQGITNDWQDYVFRNTFNTDHQVTFSGGTESTQYMSAVSYLHNPGVVYNSNYDRISVYSSISQKLNRWLNVGLTTQFVHRETGGVTPNLEHAIKQSPYGIYKDETGMYYEEPMDYSNFPNPMKDVNADQKNTSRNVLVNGYIDITFCKGLTFKSQFGYNYRDNFTGTYYGRNTVTGRKVNGRASTSTSFTTDYTWENILKYDRDFGKHHFDATALFSMQQKKNNSNSQAGESFVNDDSSFYKMDGAEKSITIGSSYWKENMMSYMLRLNYGYAGRYLITLTGRADGASVFGANNKFGFFPSAAVAWNMSEEGFIKENTDKVDMLKIRLSYGANGNNAISRYTTLDRLYSTNGVKYIYGDGSTAVNSAYLPSNGIGNPDLKWETTYTANLGIDFLFFQGRLGGSVDMYLSKTKDLLMTRTVPIMNGYNRIWDNIGATQNKGIELSLNSVNIRKANFTWSTDLTFFLNRDKIVELRGDGKDDVNNKWFIGQPLSVYYDYNMIGIWQEGDEFTFVDEEGNVQTHQKGAVAGSAKLEDVDGNGIIDSDDRKIIGSTRPSFTMSMGNRFQYKNLYFSFLLNGKFGMWMSDNVANITSYSFGSGNYIHGVKYWTPETPDADVVSPGYVNTFSHGYYKKMNYVTLKNITLGYKLPKTAVSKIGIKGLDLSLSINNVCALSNMRQMLNYDNTWFASYPTARSYMLGFTITF